MAQAPTLYDFDLSLSHVDRTLDLESSLKVARHPSETMERVWLRVLAYCWLHAERIAFGAGLSDPDAPDIEARDYTGEITLWVRVGKADPIKVQRAVDQNSRAQVAVVFDSPRRLQTFLEEARQASAGRVAKATLAAVDPGLLQSLAQDESRRAKVSVTIVGDHFYIDRSGASVDGPLTRGTL